MTVDFHRRSRGHQSVRFFRRTERGEMAVHVSRRTARRPVRLCRAGRGRAAAASLAEDDFARAAQHRRVSGRAQSASAFDGALHRPPRTRRADAGRNARHRRRLLPRLGLAAGADSPPHRTAGAFRLRLSHPAQARREIARRSVRRRAGLHRPARLGRSLSSRRRLDRLRPDLGSALRRRAYPGRGDAALPLGGADHRPGRAEHRHLLLRHEHQAHRREAARHRAVLRRSLGRARCARPTRSTPILPPTTCA